MKKSHEDFPLVLDIKLHQCNIFIIHIETVKEVIGLLRELNPGPLAPEARIMPLDQAARYVHARENGSVSPRTARASRMAA